MCVCTCVCVFVCVYGRVHVLVSIEAIVTDGEVCPERQAVQCQHSLHVDYTCDDRQALPATTVSDNFF